MYNIISRPPHDDFSINFFSLLYRDRKIYGLENALFLYMWTASICLDDAITFKMSIDETDMFPKIFNTFFKMYVRDMIGTTRFLNTKQQLFDIFVKKTTDPADSVYIRRNYMKVREDFYKAYDSIQKISFDRQQVEEQLQHLLDSGDTIVFFIKDHFRISLTDWSTTTTEISLYLSNMCEHYNNKKFIIVTSLENLDKEIKQPNCTIIPMGGDITNQYPNRHDRICVTEKNMDSDKYFIALNRGPRAHRIYTVSALYGYNLENHGHITYLSSKPNDKQIKDHINFSSTCEFNNITQEGYARFIETLSDNEDMMDIYKNKDNDNIENFNNALVPIYRNSFVEIVSETSYNELSFNVTEKIQNCIYGANFPLVVSSPGYVEFMRQMGIDMFDDIIDHSYDNELDPCKRIHKMINDNIELLCTDKAKQLWERNKHRFIKNQEHMLDKFYDIYACRFWAMIKNEPYKMNHTKKPTMNYYYFFRPLFPHRYGINKLKGFLKLNLTNYIDYTDISQWFNMSPFLVNMTKLDEIFDIQNSPEFKTITLVMNPYKKTFACYLQEIIEADPSVKLETVDDIRKHASIEGFQEFLDTIFQRDIDLYKLNVVDINNCDVKITYELRHENIAEDLKAIPELSSDIDTNLFSEIYPLLEIYREFYTDKSKEYVGSIYQKDIDYYKYTF